MYLDSRILLPAALGLSSHHLLYKQGEWHLKAPFLFRMYLALAIALYLVQLCYQQSDGRTAFSSWLLMVTSHNAALFGSIAIYRLFFHSLRQFPGPPLARVSKFWHVWKCRTSQNHLVLEELRQRYGDFVRTGPNELTIFAPTALPTLLQDRNNGITKSVWYDFLHPLAGLNSIRENSIHDRRRRIWDRAFSPKALQDYEARVLSYGHALENRIASMAGDRVDVTSWFYWFSFDLMGDFAFAKSFHMLENGQFHHAIILLRNGLSLLGYLTPVPWLGQIALSMTSLSPVRNWNAMVQFCKNRMLDRLEMTPVKRDISSWLIEASTSADTMEEDQWLLFGDAITMIIAGSDTVALTLVYLFNNLSRYPHQAEKLYNELQNIESVEDFAELKRLPRLNALINETLRLQPAVPTGGLRDVPPGGINIGNQYIPGSVTLCIPQYSLSRSGECFVSPNDFIPERWLSRPELIKDQSGFAPFSLGRSNCVGKNLALAELRFVVALLVSKYDVQFASGDSGASCVASTKDCFTAVPGKLELIFTLRSSGLNAE